MIRIISITIYNAGTSDKLHYETFREKHFSSEGIIQKWIAGEERRWSEDMGFPVKAYPIRRRMPKVKINMDHILVNTAQVMGVDMDGVLSQSRKRIYVDVRKIACMILIDADYTIPEIENTMPFKNRVIYNYRDRMEDRLAIEPGFQESYEQIKRKVMDITILNNHENSK